MVPQRGKAARSAESKAAPRDGRQEGRGVSFTQRQSESEAPVVSQRLHKAQRPTRAVDVGGSLGWNERMLAALENGVKGGQWFSLIDKVYRPQTLRAAWSKVAKNAGAAGVDRQSIEQFAAGEEVYLRELEEALKRGSYQPLAVRRVEISKGAGKMRPLGIPAVKDRIVQTAIKLVIEPIFEREFLEMSYGFRPQLGCKDALREVERLLKEGYSFVVDADITSYFDTIDWERLIERISERISDGRMLELIEAFLHQDRVTGMQRWTPSGGTPQGAVITPLLANIYLHPLDCPIKQKGYRMVRYADDFVVLCRSAEQAQAALAEVKAGWNKRAESECGEDPARGLSARRTRL